MKSTSIMKYLGILFVGIGAIAGVVILRAGGFGQTLFALLFMALFCGIGGFFAIMGFRMDRSDAKILKEGLDYMGKILDYREDRRILINDEPALSLVVRYFRKGQIQEALVHTGEVDRTKYPLGATVTIRVLDGKSVLVPGSISSMVLEQEADLLNPDFNPNVNISSIGMKCPSCGAAVTVPYGMARICPYCDTKITVDAEGHLI